MNFVAFSALFLLLASVASAFHIVPPANLTACDPVTIEYDTRTGEPPFNLAFHTDSGNGTILEAFTNVNGTSFTVDQLAIAAGTNVVIVLGDACGKGSATPPIPVNAGNSSSCLSTPQTCVPPVPAVTSTSPPTPNLSGLPPTSTPTPTPTSTP